MTMSDHVGLRPLQVSKLPTQLVILSGSIKEY